MDINPIEEFKDDSNINVEFFINENQQLLAKIRFLMNKNKQLEQELLQKEILIEQYQNQFQKWQQSSIDAENWRNEIEKYKQEIKELLIQSKKKDKEIDDLQKQIHRFKRYQDRVHKFVKPKLEALEAQILILKSQWEKAVIEKKRLNEQNQTYEKLIKEIKLSFEQTIDQMQKAFEQEKSILLKQMDEMLETLKETSQKAAQYEVLLNENTRLKNEILHCRKKLEDHLLLSQKEIATLKSRLEELQEPFWDSSQQSHS